MRLKTALALLCACVVMLAAPAWGATAAEKAAACVSCHDEEDLPDMSRGPHADKPTKPPMAAAAALLSRRAMGERVDARTPNCITCHGESTRHAGKVEKGQERVKPDVVFSKKTTLTADARNDICMDCHRKDPRRMQWAGSQHQGADLTCNSCHKVHTNRDKVMFNASQTEVCFACHREQRAQLSKPSHHPIPEGKMGCSDCHNTHGSVGPKLARRDSTNDTCYTCHAEKRGPFVHPHEPVTEDCAACHNPHGSSVAGMLKARPPLLCQQCHTPHVAGGVGALAGQPGVFNRVTGQSGPELTANSSGKNVVNFWQGRSCMGCHTQVHGSNNPSATNPTPQFMLR